MSVDDTKKGCNNVSEIIDKLISGEKVKESYILEFKKSPNALKIEQIIAMLNTKGGLIIIGIDENNNNLVGVNEKEDIKKVYNNLIKNNLKEMPNLEEIIEYNEIYKEINGEKKRFFYFSMKTLKTDFILKDGRIYLRKEDKTRYIKFKRELKKYILERITLKDDLDSFKTYIKKTITEIDTIILYKRNLEKRTTHLVSSYGTFPKGINSKKFEEILNKVKFLLFEYNIDKEDCERIKKCVKLIEHIEGKEEIITKDDRYMDFIKKLKRFYTLNYRRYLDLTQDSRKLLIEIDEKLKKIY